tara:strand:- start:1419 stop:2042 length:624 start_codon:yes stop_codon:yes gene_type:complete
MALKQQVRPQSIPPGQQIFEEEGMVSEPRQRIPTQSPDTGNVKVVSDFIIRDFQGPLKKEVDEEIGPMKPPIQEKLGNMASKYIASELNEAAESGNKLNPDSVVDVSTNVINYLFNHASKMGVYKPASMEKAQEDQAVSLTFALRSLMDTGVLPGNQGLKWARDALAAPAIDNEQLPAMGQIQSQRAPEEVSFEEEEIVTEPQMGVM